MNEVSVWITQYQQPLLLACYGLLALTLLLKCGERKGRLPHLIFFLILFVMAAVIFLAKDDPAIWIPAAVALLTVAAPTALSWKPADKPDGMRQYEEELKKLRQQILDLQASGSMADDKQRQLLEAQLQAVQEHLTDIRESWKEEQLRRKAADEALDQMKCQMPDARIEKAQVSLRQGDTKAAKETFAEVRKQAGKAAALAAHHEGKLAEGEVNYAEAMELYRTAALLEKDNPDYLLAAGKMARKLAEYKQAQEWLERLLELREAEGKNDAGLGDALHELALLHKDLGQYATAEPLYLRAVAVKEQALGKEHPDVAQSLNNLAGLYESQGRYEDAEPLYKRALAINEKSLGKDHPSVATTLNNLALLYESQGRYEDAEPLYKRSLVIKEKSLGKDHPSVATTLNNLAGLYESQGRYEAAEPLYKRSLVIKEQKLGKDHPSVATTLNNLAGLYESQGRYEEAEPLYKRDLAISEKSLGKDHPSVATTLNNLAGLYYKQGKYKDAEPLFQRCLAIFKAKLPAGHPNIKTVQANYDELKRKMEGE